MIRATTSSDKDALLQVATSSGLFEPEQIGDLAQMLDGHFAADASTSDIWLTDDHEGQPVGVAYAAPERMTDGTWNLYLIAVHRDHQRRGRGRSILQHVEKMLTDLGVRLLLIETAGIDDFDYVRSFYERSGYEEEARIRGFYEAGVDKVVYRKSLV